MRMRVILVHWMWQVAADKDLSFRVFYLGVQYLDKHLAASSGISRRNFQGFGIVALLIASKYEDVYCMRLDDAVHLCNNTYTSSEIAAFEREMLIAIAFRMELSTPFLKTPREELTAVLMCIDGTISVYTRRMVCIVRRLHHHGPCKAIQKPLSKAKKRTMQTMDVFEHVRSMKCGDIDEVVQFYVQRRLKSPQGASAQL